MPGARGLLGRGCRGFTLLELLVTLALLALLASISFRGLGSILDTGVHIDAELQRWQAASAFFAQLEDDISSAIEQPARDQAGRSQAALILRREASLEALTQMESRLTLTRLGSADAGASHTEPRRVGYRLREGTLEYLLWPALNVAPEARPLASPVLENVAAFRLRALGRDGAWSAIWPADRPVEGLPRALEAEVVLVGGARLRRILALR